MVRLPDAFHRKPEVAQTGWKFSSEKFLKHRLIISVHEKPQHSGVITISMGLPAFDPARHAFGFNEFIRQADHTLYQAKEVGRNRIAQYSEVVDGL